MKTETMYFCRVGLPKKALDLLGLGGRERVNPDPYTRSCWTCDHMREIVNGNNCAGCVGTQAKFNWARRRESRD